MSALSGSEDDPTAPSCSAEASGEQHEAQDKDTATTSGRSDGEGEPPVKTPCAFYMRTGTCAYGERCKFLHPEDRPTVYSNSRGLPLRPAEPECTFYLRNGWCAFAETCKFHHPELPPGAPGPPAAAGQQRHGSPAGQQQQRHQQHGRPHKNGTTGGSRQQQQHPAGRPQHQHQHQHQQAQYPMGPYAFYAMAPYHAGMASPPGQGLLMHYGFYPAMPPNSSGSGNSRAFPGGTSAMIHPVMHLRPYGSGPLHMHPPVQRGTLQRSSSGPREERDSGGRPARTHSGLDARGSAQWGGSSAGPAAARGRAGHRGGGGGGAHQGSSSSRSPPSSPAAAPGAGGFSPLGPSAAAKAAAAAAVAAATAAPMPGPSSPSAASPTKRDTSPAKEQQVAAAEADS